MHASEVTPEVAANANELYWTSTRSVNQIAEDLDLSKGALYGALVPLGSHRACPRCGEEAGWANRTARDRGELECGACGWSGSRSQTGVYDLEGVDGLVEFERNGISIDDGRNMESAARTSTSSPLRSIAGGAVIGAALGLALVFWSRRR